MAKNFKLVLITIIDYNLFFWVLALLKRKKKKNSPKRQHANLNQLYIKLNSSIDIFFNFFLFAQLLNHSVNFGLPKKYG